MKNVKETKVFVMLFMDCLGKEIESLRNTFNDKNQLKKLTNIYNIDEFNISLIEFNKRIGEIVSGLCDIVNINNSFKSMVVSNCEIELFSINEICASERISRLDSLERMTNKFVDNIDL